MIVRLPQGLDHPEVAVASGELKECSLRSAAPAPIDEEDTEGRERSKLS